MLQQDLDALVEPILVPAAVIATSASTAALPESPAGAAELELAAGSAIAAGAGDVETPGLFGRALLPEPRSINKSRRPTVLPGGTGLNRGPAQT